MRRPQRDSEHDVPTSQRSSSALSRMKRFLSASLGRSSHSSTYCDVQTSPASQSLTNLRNEGQALLGKPLENIMSLEGKEMPYGVPSFVHHLCRHMLEYGVSYETLVADNWGTDHSSSEKKILKTIRSELSSEAEIEAAGSAELFRLFLEKLPQPLMCKRTISSLTSLYKDIENLVDDCGDLELFEESAFHIRNVLYQMLPWYTLQFLQFLTAFLHQLLTSNHNACSVTTSALSRLLGRVLTKDDTSYLLAKMLLLNYNIIFQDMENLIQEKSYSSDSVSSAGDSRGGETTDEADLFTPEDDESAPGEPWLPEESLDPEDDSTTTTTTDTDDFRSPPVSPMKFRHQNCPSSLLKSRSRSTDDFKSGKGEFISKISPFSKTKSFVPSITGLLDSSYDTWSLRRFVPRDGAPSEESYDTSLDGSCISGEPISDLESDSDRDADGSDTEGGPKEGTSCPHEERRSSERFFRAGHRAPSAKKTKRRIRRKHSKESELRVHSSEEEERETPVSLVHLLSEDSAPAPFDPSPPDTSDSFSALLSYADPVPSNRVPYGLPEEEEVENDYANNWLRTAPHYSRELDDEWGPPEEGETKSRRRGRSMKYDEPAILGSPHEDQSRFPGHSTFKLLTKNVSGIKRKIKKFEEEFEKSFGYRPSHSDKMKHKEIKKYLSDLSKAKKDLKRMKEEILDKKSIDWPKSFPMSLLRCQESTSQTGIINDPSLAIEHTKGTYRKMEECLTAKRTDANRPEDVEALTLDQLQAEKSDIQRALLFYESQHGRPSSKEDKELVRPLYDRYRFVKRSVNKLKLRQKESVIELAPILEHVVMDFTSPQHRGSLKEDQDEKEPWEGANVEGQFTLNIDPHPDMNPTTFSPAATATELNLGDLHALPIQELKERKREAREEKKRLRHSLREYEEKFEKETGRKMQKEDRGSMEKTYNEYKHVKAKLRLLEALLSKHVT